MRLLSVLSSTNAELLRSAAAYHCSEALVTSLAVRLLSVLSSTDAELLRRFGRFFISTISWLARRAEDLMLRAHTWLLESFL